MKHLNSILILSVAILFACDRTDFEYDSKKIAVEHGVATFPDESAFHRQLDELITMGNDDLTEWKKKSGLDHSLNPYEGTTAELPPAFAALLNKDGLIKVGSMYYFYLPGNTYSIPEDKMHLTEVLKKNPIAELEGVTRYSTGAAHSQSAYAAGDIKALPNGRIDGSCSTSPFTCSQFVCSFTDNIPGGNIDLGMDPLTLLRAKNVFNLKYKPYPCLTCDIEFRLEAFTSIVWGYDIIYFRLIERKKVNGVWTESFSPNVQLQVSGTFQPSGRTFNTSGTYSVAAPYLPSEKTLTATSINYAFVASGYPQVCGSVTL